MSLVSRCALVLKSRRQICHQLTEHLNQVKRIYFAILIAPPIGLATGFLLTGTPLVSTLLYVAIGLQVAYPIAIVLGFLVLRYSRKYGRPTLRAVVILSATASTFFWAAVVWPPVFPDLSPITLETYMLCIIVATVFSVVFWRIAFPRSAA